MSGCFLVAKATRKQQSLLRELSRSLQEACLAPFRTIGSCPHVSQARGMENPSSQTSRTATGERVAASPGRSRKRGGYMHTIQRSKPCLQEQCTMSFLRRRQRSVTKPEASYFLSLLSETDEGPHGSLGSLTSKQHVYEATGEHDDWSYNQILHHYDCLCDIGQSLTPANASVYIFQYKALTS